MNKRQKIFLVSIILVGLVSLGLITAFSMSNQTSDKLNILVTFYPLAYFTQAIGGDQVHITQLVPNNTEIHNWEPSVSHILSAENADVIIYNGAGLDQWVGDDILPALSNSKTRVIVESTHDLPLIKGEEHGDEAGDNHDHGLYDPHTWISPHMAKMQAEKIYEAIVQADPEHESYYTQQWQILKSKLDQLDNNYATSLYNTTKNVIFVSHEAFGYLAQRYGFEQHGVIGLSADEQPSITALANLINEMKQNEIYAVYVDPMYSNEYVQTIKSEIQTQTGETVKVLKLYLMLGPNDDMDVVEQMQANLDNLKIGLEPYK